MPKPTVLLLGPGVQHTQDFYDNSFLRRFTVIQNDTKNREEFISALQSHKFGNFSAILKPHVETGQEPGQWDSELISLLPHTVRIFAAGGAGYDWVPNPSLLGSRGVWYANAAGAGDDATSDCAMWHILSCFRQFTKGQLAARTADPERFDDAHNEILELSRNPRGHVLGIVGFGGIGRMLARKARAAWGMEVHYYDVVRASEEVERESGGAVYHEELEGLLKVADVVSLHTPLNAYTRNLMNEERIGMMKDGARLVNTARGQVVQEEALVAALRSGKLSAAGIDVHYHEPQVSRELAGMENVTLTPHLGGVARETIVGFEMTSMKNIMAVVGDDGAMIGEPSTLVNAKAVREALGQ